MRGRIVVGVCALLCMLMAFSAQAQEAKDKNNADEEKPSQERTKFFPSDVKKNSVFYMMKRVADWQISKYDQTDPRSWSTGTFLVGLMDFYKMRKDKRYYTFMKRAFDSVEWKVFPRPYDPNVLATAQAYVDFYMLEKDPKMIQYTRYVLDAQFQRQPSEIEVTYKDNKHWVDCWSRSEALFSAPPAWAKFSEATGEMRYNYMMDDLWKATHEHLYDKFEFLYYHDDRYINVKSKAGKKIFWARGNGWVVAGLAKTLEVLPKNYKSRSLYEQIFKDMSAKLVTLQQPGGYWPSSLLDTTEYNCVESSGTALFCYAFAWGINNGYLDRATYYPAVQKAWKVLVESVHLNGMLGYVQRNGDAPNMVSYNDTEWFGSGAFLMAGSEVYKLSD
ncbi:MAG: glycoside hydrolase family 88 protein [Bacteroidota bacterium]|nr:glycoside hydrolase family 88 protein [Bacteroidota bacterium]